MEALDFSVAAWRGYLRFETLPTFVSFAPKTPKRSGLVEPRRLELLTFSLRTRRSTN